MWTWTAVLADDTSRAGSRSQGPPRVGHVRLHADLDEPLTKAAVGAAYVSASTPPQLFPQWTDNACRLTPDTALGPRIQLC